MTTLQLILASSSHAESAYILHAVTLDGDLVYTQHFDSSTLDDAQQTALMFSKLLKTEYQTVVGGRWLSRSLSVHAQELSRRLCEISSDTKSTSLDKRQLFTDTHTRIADERAQLLDTLGLTSTAITTILLLVDCNPMQFSSDFVSDAIVFWYFV